MAIISVFAANLEVTNTVAINTIIGVKKLAI
jgi:hypothetical protein